MHRLSKAGLVEYRLPPVVVLDVVVDRHDDHVCPLLKPVIFAGRGVETNERAANASLLVATAWGRELLVLVELLSFLVSLILGVVVQQTSHYLRIVSCHESLLGRRSRIALACGDSRIGLPAHPDTQWPDLRRWVVGRNRLPGPQHKAVLRERLRLLRAPPEMRQLPSLPPPGQPALLGWEVGTLR